MKITKSLIISSILIAFVGVGCAVAGGTVSEESLGLRKTNLYTEESETKPEEGIYTTSAPGTSQKFERAC